MQYEGLFQLDRLEEGRRTKFEPRTNLKTLLPLKPKQTVKAEFTWERDGQNGVLLVEMAVKGFEDLYIGLCKYSVLKIERSETGSANPPRFVYSEYYSPLLKLSLAKEYRYADGRTQIVKFDRIYLKPPTPGGALGQQGQDSGRLSPPRKVVITADGGGLVESYEAFWQNLADKGAEVEIRGDCASACTLVISYIPKERLCFDANGLLLFHMATQVSRQGLKNPDPLRTEAMVDSYPDDIRAWISKQGGYRMMPWKNHWWMLRAPELWAMGYRRCSD